MSIKTISLPLVLLASCGLSFFLGAITSANAAPAVSFEFCIIEECTPAYQREAKDHGLEITPPSSSDCAMQKQCMALAQKLYQLPENEKSCSVGQFKEFEAKLQEIDARYSEIGLKYNIDMAAHNAFGSANGTKIMAGLGRMLVERFSKCEDDKFFPDDRNQCLTSSCKEILEKIQNTEVSKEGCNRSFASLSNNGFKFEKTILENAEKKHVEACQDANITKIKYGKPANLIMFPSEIYKRELADMEAGVKLESEVTDTLDKFKVNAESCAMDYWLPIYAKLKEMRDQYAQVQSIGSAGQNAFDSLTTQLNRSLVECKENNLFPQNIEECITDTCKKVVAEIKAVPISENGCQSKNIRFSYGERHFTFEESLVEKANEEHVQACIDANITPVKTLGLNGKLYKKDLPFFEAGEKAEDALESALHGLDAKKTTPERCSRELFESTGKNLQIMRENYGKLSAVKNYGQLAFENLEFARDRQAVTCARDNLFPITVEYGTCFTSHCKETLEGIKNFKVGEKSCDFDIHGLSPNTLLMLKPEIEYVQDRQNELYNQCVDAGFLNKSWRRKVKRHAPEPPQPSRASAQPNVAREIYTQKPSRPSVQPKVVGEISTQKPLSSLPSVTGIALKEDPTLEPAQRALLKRFYSMDVKERKGGPNGTYQIIPYAQLANKLKTLKATPEDCNAEKVFIPIYSSVVYFEDMFEAEYLPFPKELIDLRNQVWQYRDRCVQAGF